MLFFVKVRVDTDKLAEFGLKLRDGAFSAHPLIAYCLADDPAVGLNIWEAENLEAFEAAFAPQRDYYSEVIEIVPVITAQEAQKALAIASEQLTPPEHPAVARP
jgi:hypothetical protein